MVIEIPSDSEPSDATVISSCPIESSEIQQLQQQPETDPMERTWKQPVNVVVHPTILTPASHVVPTPAHRPPIMDPRQPNEPAIGGPSEFP